MIRLGLAVLTVAVIALAAASAVFLVASPTVTAGGPEPTPTPDVLQPPAAPSNVRVEDGTLIVWDDNSGNEDGFRILKRVTGGSTEVALTLPADTTSAPIPQVSFKEQCAGVTFSIVAFNDAGESDAVVGPAIAATDCGGGLQPPPLGAGPAGGGSAPAWPWAVAALGLALAALGGGAWLRARAFTEKRKPEWKGR